jgi:hypothetical protein
MCITPLKDPTGAVEVAVRVAVSAAVPPEAIGPVAPDIETPEGGAPVAVAVTLDIDAEPVFFI